MTNQEIESAIAGIYQKAFRLCCYVNEATTLGDDDRDALHEAIGQIVVLGGGCEEAFEQGRNADAVELICHPSTRDLLDYTGLFLEQNNA